MDVVSRIKMNNKNCYNQTTLFKDLKKDKGLRVSGSKGSCMVLMEVKSYFCCIFTTNSGVKDNA